MSGRGGIEWDGLTTEFLFSVLYFMRGRRWWSRRRIGGGLGPPQSPFMGKLPHFATSGVLPTASSLALAILRMFDSIQEYQGVWKTIDIPDICHGRRPCKFFWPV